MAAELAKTYDEWDIYTFAALSGDLNPAHIDQAFAERGVFGGKIAHGMLTASLISAVLGMRLPGPGSIYLSQDLKFLRPVRIGDTITARVEVAELTREKNRVTLRTTCTNQNGERVLEGTALVMPPRSKAVAGEGVAVENLAPPAASSVPPSLHLAASIRKKAGFVVGQRMTRDPITISPNRSLAEARVLLNQHRIRHLPVVDGERVVGIITDGDIRQASFPGAPGGSASEREALLDLVKVGEVMTREVVTIGPYANIGEAASLLLSLKIGGLPVLEDGRLVGVITVTDALEALVDIVWVRSA